MAYNRINSIIRPRVTEKSSLLSEKNVFTFEVLRDATKYAIAHDIKVLYNVTPLKVTIVNTPAKKIVSRGKIGSTQTPKKAYVFLKKGDSIDLA